MLLRRAHGQSTDSASLLPLAVRIIFSIKFLTFFSQLKLHLDMRYPVLQKLLGGLFEACFLI